MMLADLTITR